MTHLQVADGCKVWVTDHALIRYLERVRGLEFDALRNEIARLACEGVQFKTMGGVWHEEKGIVMLFGDNRNIITVYGRKEAREFDGKKLIDGSRIVMGD